RKDSRDGFAVTGLTQVACPSDAAAVRYCVRALQHRHTRGHRLNEYSSRSHCLITFVFASKEAGPDGQMGAAGGIRRYGKLALVDLAGSERLKDTGNTEKGAVRETGAINKSLFTLGQVLAALSVRSSGAASAATSFVPYRDSKLTQLLWDGLRGSGRCLMLACLGPMRSAAEESLNTLHFASMALRIKAEPVVLLDPQDQLVLDLRKTIIELRMENRQLAGALSQLSAGVDPYAVLQALPDTLRAHAATSGGAAAAATDVGPSASYGQLPPPSPPPPPPPPPAAQDYGYLAGGGYGYGGPAGPPPPAAPPPPLLPSPSLHTSVSYGSAASGHHHQRHSGPAHGELPSPGPASVSTSAASGAGRGGLRNSVNSGGSVGSGGSAAAAGRRRRPAPAPALANSPYSSSPPRGKRSPGRSKSVGRSGGGGGGSAGAGGGGAGGGGGRPSYLTEDPGALLYGYSAAAIHIPSILRGAGGTLRSVATALAGAGAGPVVRCHVQVLLLLYGLPRLLAGSIIAHELMHAWLRMAGVVGLELRVEEGLCQLMAGLWLDRQHELLEGDPEQQRLASFFSYQIRTDTSEVYGDGFRDAMEAFQTHGLTAVIRNVQKYG
ncbi:Chromosome-associated kinesin KIF4, partial [Tetrabaena socialis]